MKKLSVVETIMTEFSKRTCIRGKGCTPVRYLWTDAFAVCNFLELFHRTGRESYKEEALKLVDQVHHVLGKHRSDDTRSGWISGLDEAEGEAHPTIGGLRIGKKQNERKENEPQDEHLEWEQDGQHFHYLTKWMHALNLVSEATGNPKYNRWALELAQTAYDRFTYTTLAGARRMVWKMSIDLSYPLVSSMGQHDALDGYITYLELGRTASKYTDMPDELHIDTELAGLSQMSQSVSWDTDDPLGIGGLLSDACILTQLIISAGMEYLSEMLSKFLRHALRGIELFLRTNILKYPAQYRLAFRELGLSIGLHGVEKIQMLLSEHAECFSNDALLRSQLKELESYLPLCKFIEDFWLESENQKSSTWTEHLDINSVMLATSLDADGYLSI
ncbi:MAG: hypothetical protein P794_10080 [Epsilonproteobacteria bacterium (ex Lamellibrachia satsuma)]|nr:MAG: hypothetical protein P794_10080 [Epsilonproteobacteria bacterium (ex Lamellibrachia satsuma)]